ncbi:MAG TPA: hypothetical protein VHX62_07250, partial [Solirubrobacteraceae bacterium]|nr:hypothetical protein [Solirubrobacteraceae bacterium]
RIVEGHGGTLYNTATPDLHLLSGGKVGSVPVKAGTTNQQRGFLKLPPSIDRVLDPFHPTTYGKSTKTSIYGPNEGTLGGSEGTLGGNEGTLGPSEGSSR